MVVKFVKNLIFGGEDVVDFLSDQDERWINREVNICNFQRVWLYLFLTLMIVLSPRLRYLVLLGQEEELAPDGGPDVRRHAEREHLLLCRVRASRNQVLKVLPLVPQKQPSISNKRRKDMRRLKVANQPNSGSLVKFYAKSLQKKLNTIFFFVGWVYSLLHQIRSSIDCIPDFKSIPLANKPSLMNMNLNKACVLAHSTFPVLEEKLRKITGNRESTYRMYPCNDRYQPREYVACADTSQVPGFPCARDETCTPESRKCAAHARILYVKTLTGETYEIPYGNWEVPLWYKHRIQDLTGIDPAQQRLIYAGKVLEDDQRHNGIQIGATLHLIVREWIPLLFFFNCSWRSSPKHRAAWDQGLSRAGAITKGGPSHDVIPNFRELRPKKTRISRIIHKNLLQNPRQTFYKSIDKNQQLG